MPIICQRCGYSNLDNAKFCGKCGATLIQTPIPSQQPIAPQQIPINQQFGNVPVTNYPVKGLIVVGFDQNWNPYTFAFTTDKIIRWKYDGNKFGGNLSAYAIGIAAGIAVDTTLEALGGAAGAAGAAVARYVKNKIREGKIKKGFRDAMSKGPLNLVITDPNILQQIPIPGINGQPAKGYGEITKVKSIKIYFKMNDEFPETTVQIKKGIFSSSKYKFLTVRPEEVIQILSQSKFASAIKR